MLQEAWERRTESNHMHETMGGDLRCLWRQGNGGTLPKVPKGGEQKEKTVWVKKCMSERTLQPQAQHLINLIMANRKI